MHWEADESGFRRLTDNDATAPRAHRRNGELRTKNMLLTLTANVVSSLLGSTHRPRAPNCDRAKLTFNPCSTPGLQRGFAHGIDTDRGQHACGLAR